MATPAKQRGLNLFQKIRNAGLAFKRFWFTGPDAVSADESTGILERISLCKISPDKRDYRKVGIIAHQAQKPHSDKRTSQDLATERSYFLRSRTARLKV